MKMKSALRQFAVPLLSLTLSAAALYASGSLQDELQHDQRDIEAKEVVQGRPQSKESLPQGNELYRVRQPTQPTEVTVTRNKPKSKRVPAKPLPKVVAQKFPLGTPPSGKRYLTLGVTLWRVRVATQAELNEGKVATQRMKWQGQERNVVVARASDESAVTSGDLMQMTIEYLPGAEPRASGPVYLYVINCEQMPRGNWENAHLIFPTKKTYKGDNRLLSGQTVTLPDPNRPFVITRSADATSQQYETYLLIVSPVPLEDQLPQEIEAKAMALPPEFARQWWRDWGGGEVRADLLARLGQARTQRELGASGDIGTTRGTVDPDENLTQGDPPPQTVFRRVVKPGEIMVVAIRLPFKDAATKP